MLESRLARAFLLIIRLTRVDLSLFRFTSLVKWNYDRFVLGKRNTNKKGLVKQNFSRSTLVKRTFDKRFLAKRDSSSHDLHERFSARRFLLVALEGREQRSHKNPLLGKEILVFQKPPHAI